MAAKKIAKREAAKQAHTAAGGKQKSPKSKPAKQDAKFRKSIDQRVEKLTEEVRCFLALPHPERITSKQWLHDPDVAAPSADLLAYIANEMLYGDNRQTCCEAAALAGIDSAFAFFIDCARKLDSTALKNTVRSAVARLTFTGWWGGEDRAHWWLCRWGMKHEHEQAARQCGARRIAHAINEILVARSLHSGDWQQINELAAVIKAAKINDRNHQPQASTEIALQIFKWHRHLVGQLGRPPSRHELKEFILEVNRSTEEGDTDCPTSNDAWSEAVRLLQVPLAGARSIRKDGMTITRLVSEARKHGPKYPEPPTPTKRAEPAWAALALGKKQSSKNPI